MRKKLSMMLAVMMLFCALSVSVSAAKPPVSKGKKMYVTGTKHFLALRRAPAYKDSNIKAKLYNGQKVKIKGSWKGKYVKVYSYTRKKSGYVDGTYLKSNSGKIKTVRKVKHFLALRTAAAYDDDNIIGKMYNGDEVRVNGNKKGSYVWVYSFDLERSGYVNKNKLR